MGDASEQIRNLLGRYCEAMDAADWDAVGQLFSAGALTDEDGQVVARGAEAVAALYRVMVQLYDGTPRTRHLTTNAVIEVDGDTASCRSAFLVLQQLVGSPLVPIAAGRYRDRFTCVDGSWQFTERAFVLEQAGDLSSHLG
jgi:3-phenylpropionate/cinnamic acid dioxygenase small subunit